MDQIKTKKKKRDPYRNLKWLGYRLVELPETYGVKEFVQFAKFQLAIKTKRLLKDPIWKTYTNEEILIEFFAHQFDMNKEARMRFEQEIGASDVAVDAFSAWADKEMEKEAKIRDKLLGATEDRIRFSPEDVMGEDT